MKKSFFELVLDSKILPILRSIDIKTANTYISTLLDCGVNIVEVSLSGNDGLKVLKNVIKEYPNAVIGAGTVLGIEDAVRAMDIGAQFLVSPGYIPTVVKFSMVNNIPIIPGAATPTEITKLVLSGISVIKIFPAAQLTPIFFKEIKGPFPNIKMIAVGGINVNNAKDYVEAGAACLGLGTGLFRDMNGNIIVRDELKKRINVLRSFFK